MCRALLQVQEKAIKTVHVHVANIKCILHVILHDVTTASESTLWQDAL